MSASLTWAHCKTKEPDYLYFEIIKWLHVCRNIECCNTTFLVRAIFLTIRLFIWKPITMQMHQQIYMIWKQQFLNVFLVLFLGLVLFIKFLEMRFDYINFLVTNLRPAIFLLWNVTIVKRHYLQFWKIVANFHVHHVKKSLFCAIKKNSSSYPNFFYLSFTHA